MNSRIPKPRLFPALFLLFLSVIHSELFADKKRFLWEVKSETATVYLLGSIHMAKADMYPLDPAIEKAFKNSGVLVVEIDITKTEEGGGETEDEEYSDDDGGSGGLEEKILEMMKYEDNSTMEDHLSDSALAKMKKYMSERQLPYEMFKNFKPQFIFLTAMSIQLLNHGFLPQYGIDLYFLNKAGTKKIYELETAEEQLNLLFGVDSSISDDDLIDFSIKDNLNSIAQMDTMYAAWMVGDSAKMYDIVTRPVQDYPAYKPIMDELLDKRNFKMADNIAEYLKTKQTYFVVVGAAHFVGGNGIINLLKQKKKYQIKRL